MRVEEFLRVERAALARQDRARRRKGAADLQGHRPRLRPARGDACREGRAARRPRRRLHGQLRRSGRRDLRDAEGRRGLLAGQRFDQGGKARLHPEQLRRRRARHAAQARRGRRRCARRSAVGEASRSSPAGRERRRSPNAMHWREALAAEARARPLPASTSTSR